MSWVVSQAAVVRAADDFVTAFNDELRGIKENLEGGEDWQVFQSQGVALVMSILEDSGRERVAEAMLGRSLRQDSVRVKINGRWVRRPAGYPVPDLVEAPPRNPPYFE